MRLGMFGIVGCTVALIVIGCGSTEVSSPVECTPASDDDFCLSKGATCGTVIGIDECGNARTVVSCGGCSTGEACSNNACVPQDQCQPESDTLFCARNSAECGGFRGTDNCGRSRFVSNCGGCLVTETCDTPTNSCVVKDAGSVLDAGGPDATIPGVDAGSAVDASSPSLDAGRDAGTPVVDAGSGVVDAGRDAGTPVVDAGSGVVDAGRDAGSSVPDAGGCSRESDATFCSRLGAVCGTLTAADNCGTQRTVGSCGTCPTQQVCSVNRCTVVCTPETDAAFCSRRGAVCGSVSGADNCGTQRTVANCGACPTGQACSATNACEAPTCAAGATIPARGTVTSTGAPAPISGTTAGTGTQTAACANGVASPESIYSWTPSFTGTATVTVTPTFDAMLYVRTGSCTGALATMTTSSGPQPACKDDGITRIAESLTFPVTPQTQYFVFVDGVAGVNGASARGSFTLSATCNAETDAAICTRLGKTCGSVTATDNCGTSRTVTCGTCPSGQQCNGSNVCACAPETNAQFCTRLGKNCGPVTANDNCGVNRRNVNCGSCSGPGQTCGGGTPSVANVCGCTPETREQFCARQFFQCNYASGTDNCGRSRSENCGSCASGTVCASGYAYPTPSGTSCQRRSNQCVLDWQCSNRQWQIVSSSEARYGRDSGCDQPARTQTRWNRRSYRYNVPWSSASSGCNLPSSLDHILQAKSACSEVFGSSLSAFWTNRTCTASGGQRGHQDSNGTCISDSSTSFFDRRDLVCLL
jgi:hypothetical protein